MRILLDMDEVLVDFVGAAAQIHGCSYNSLLPHWPRGEWSMIPALEKATSKTIPLDLFWERIHAAGESFWTDLREQPWTRELVDRVRERTDDWHIVTSPSRCPTCYSGKVKWLKRYFGSEFDRFAITPHKSIFAGPDVVLIDDRPDTLTKFVEAGGKGVIFPGVGNDFRYMLRWNNQQLLGPVFNRLDSGASDDLEI